MTFINHTETKKIEELLIGRRIVAVETGEVEINAMQIDGDDGNGYYGTGYELFVVPGE